MPHTPQPTDESVENRRSAAREAVSAIADFLRKVPGSLTPSGQRRLRGKVVDPIKAWIRLRWQRFKKEVQAQLFKEFSFLNATDVQGLYIQYHEDEDLLFQWKYFGIQSIYSAESEALNEFARLGRRRAITVEQAVQCFRNAWLTSRPHVRDLAQQLHLFVPAGQYLSARDFRPLGSMLIDQVETFIDCANARMMQQPHSRTRVKVITPDGGVLPNHKISNRFVT